MKPFKEIKKWFENQENLFYLFLIILIVPNVVLCFTEPMPIVAKVCNVLLPFSIYYMVMSWSRNCGRTFWILFPFLFFGSIPDCVVISLRTVHYCSGYVSQPGNNQFQRSLGVAGQPDTGYCYCSAVIYSGIGNGDGICHQKRELPELFIHRERKRARLAMIAGVLSLGAAYLFDSRYELKSIYTRPMCVITLHSPFNALHRHRAMQKHRKISHSKLNPFIPKRIGKSMLWLLGKRPVRLIGRFMVIIAKRTPNCQR